LSVSGVADTGSFSTQEPVKFATRSAIFDLAGRSATLWGVTAKEKLRQTVEELSEAEAQDALGFIVRRQSKRDALDELLKRAPLDDEPTTPGEDEGVREAKEQIARGEVLSADEIRREIA
jgi:hypothetical protein